MKKKHPLYQLKNNTAGQQTLKQIIGDQNFSDWFNSLLHNGMFPEAKAPWKHLLLPFEGELLRFASSSNPMLRYQALSVLLESEAPAAVRFLWDSLEDSDARVRALIAGYFAPEDRQKMYNRLFSLYLKDPVWDVRKTARERLKKDFSDLFTIIPKNLGKSEKIHCIELLSPGAAMDHDLALRFLMEKEAGIALSAAIYLEKEGCLDNLIRKASLSDLDDLTRRKKLLSSAAGCQVTTFLDKTENFKSPGSLCLATELMGTAALSAIGEYIIGETLKISLESPFIKEIKLQAVNNLLTMKTTESYELLKKTLLEFSGDIEIFRCILDKIPREGAVRLYPVLLNFLEKPDFTEEETLVRNFKRLPLSYSLKDLYRIVRDGTFSASVRKRALSVLCHYNVESTILFILENLPLFSREDMKILGCSAFQWSREEFLSLAEDLLEQNDSSVRQSLMTLLALSGIRDFIPRIENALTDADPNSRITAVKALVELDNRSSSDQILPLLHDPEDCVRAETASSLILWNREDTFDQLYAIMTDPHETDTVVRTIVEALGRTSNHRSVSMLVPILEIKPSLAQSINLSLFKKTTPDEIHIILDFYKDGSPALRNSLAVYFKRTSEATEKLLLDLLKDEEKFPLHEGISRILDDTGYTDSCIRNLKNRKQVIRKKAAEDLILIHTEKSWRGLVLAVKDISREIRIMAVRALEKLQDKDSAGILEKLKEDPDMKVQKYTIWALEKIRAGKLP